MLTVSGGYECIATWSSHANEAMFLYSPPTIDGDRASYARCFTRAVVSMDSGWYASQVHSYNAWLRLLDRDIA